VAIDFNIGEDTATHPSIAMNRGGQALLAYRYLPDVNPDPSLPQGYVNADVRVARYNGSVWTQLGQPADRNPATPVRAPSAGNSPRVGIDVTGAGLVVWQEPDDDFVDRIWARRLFPSGTMGIPLLVSPQSWGGKPLRGPADEFRMDESGFGEGAVVFRQQPGQRSAFTSARTMLNEIPDQFSQTAGKFNGPRLVDGGDAAGPGSDAGSAGVGVDPYGAFVVTQGLGDAAFAVTGDEQTVNQPVQIDDGTGSVPPDPVADLSSEGASASAWRTGVPGDEGVVLREARANGAVSTNTVYGTESGPVNTLELAGSGLGDAAIAFSQGGRDNGQIVAATIDAPPGSFAVHTPVDWLRASRYTLTWDPSANGIGPVTYTALIDGQQVGDPTQRTFLKLGPADLPGGRHHVRVVATDSQGQSTKSDSGDLLIDRRAPRVRVSVSGSVVRLTIVDGRKMSGVARGAVRIDWGDGHRSRSVVRASHRYARAGSYHLVVKVRDRAGNSAVRRPTVAAR
jgi:hypothetical protein